MTSLYSSVIFTESRILALYALNLGLLNAADSL